MRRRTILTAAAALAAPRLAAPALAQAPTRLRIAEPTRSHFYAAQYVAIARGFAREQGLDVEITTLAGGDRVGALVLAGGTDVGLAGPEVPIYILNGESRDKPAIFCALTGTDGFFLISRQPVPNFTWSMLEGKRILGYRPGSTPELYLEYVLKAHGVRGATLLTNITPPARVGAWLSGAADFAIFLDPDLIAAERANQASVITSIGHEVGRADYTSFFAMRSWLAAHGDVAQRWTNAVAAAQAWLRDASDADAAAAMAPFFPGLPPADLVTGLHRLRNAGAPILADSPLVDPAGLAKLEEIMVSGGVLPADRVPSYAALMDTRFAEAALRRRAGG